MNIAFGMVAGLFNLLRASPFTKRNTKVNNSTNNPYLIETSKFVVA